MLEDITVGGRCAQRMAPTPLSWVRLSATMSPRISISPLAARPDERLVALIREGDERAFESLVERHRGALMRYCRRMGLSHSSSEEVVQHALLQAWLALQRGAEVRDPKPWLYRIVHNAAVNATRGSKEDHGRLTDAADARVAGTGESDPHRRMAVREALTDVAALPLMQREAIFMTALVGQSHEEVASVLGITHGAVRGLLYRARATLRGAAAALTPQPLIGWAFGGARKTAPSAEGLGGISGSAGAAGVSGTLFKGTAVAGMSGTLLKGAAVAVTAGVLVGGAAIAPPHRDPGRRPKSPAVSNPGDSGLVGARSATAGTASPGGGGALNGLGPGAGTTIAVRRRGGGSAAHVKTLTRPTPTSAGAPAPDSPRGAGRMGGVIPADPVSSAQRGFPRIGSDAGAGSLDGARTGGDTGAVPGRGDSSVPAGENPAGRSGGEPQRARDSAPRPSRGDRPEAGGSAEENGAAGLGTGPGEPGRAPAAGGGRSLAEGSDRDGGPGGRDAEAQASAGASVGPAGR
jgi:RNA polymerase sigma factor (sigma-70 family)